MKRIVVYILLTFLISEAQSQDYYSDSLAHPNKSVLDTLPLIGHKKNIPMLLVMAFSPATMALGLNGDEYEIKRKPYFFNKKLKPYFYAQNDPIVIDNYNYHRKTRPVYLAGIPLWVRVYFLVD